MSNNHHPHSLPFLTKPQTNNVRDPDLPQGECTFLKRQIGGSPQRCDCVAFTPDKDRPGATCGCGHAAWTHLREHVGENVSREEYGSLVREMREIKAAMSKMHEEFNQQKTQREKDNQLMMSEFRKLFETVAKVKMLGDTKASSAHAALEQHIVQAGSHATHLEDRIEAIVDKTQNWDRVVKKVELLDEACMSLEDRLDKMDIHPAHRAPDLQSVHETPPDLASPASTLVPLDQNAVRSKSWEIRVILVPKLTQKHAFGHDSVEWRRSYSRGLHQTVSPASHSAEHFNRAVESAFKRVLQNRPWAPLVCLSSEAKELSRLPPGQHQPHLWDYAFLEKHCFAQDKLEGDILFIAPTQDELPWSYIKSLPRVAGADESCWEHNSSLDGFGVNFSRPQTARDPPLEPSSILFARPSAPASAANRDFRHVDFTKGGMNPSTWGRKTSIDTDSSSMYENSPPPYTRGMSNGSSVYAAGGVDSRLMSSGALDLLAMTALENNSDKKPGTQRHPFDPRSLTQRPATSAGPGERSMTVPPEMPTGSEMDIDDDGRGKSYSNCLQRSPSNSTSHSREGPQQPPQPQPQQQQQQQQQQFYFTGRSRRKVTTGKYKEPVELSLGSVKLPRLGFHKSSNEDKGKGKETGDGSACAA